MSEPRARAGMTIAQAQIPSHFHNLWKISGCRDEHEHATKLCRVIRHAGREVVVELLGQGGLFETCEVRLSPHMLLPVLPSNRPAPTGLDKTNRSMEGNHG